MSKVTLGASLALATLALGLAAPLVAQADATTTPVSFDTTDTVEFTANTDPTDPVDPTDPDTTNPEVPGTGDKGPLSLDYVPTLDFGSQKIATGTQTFGAKGVIGQNSGTELTQPHYVQVTDNRGTAEGWNVSAVMTPFTAMKEDPANAGQYIPDTSVKYQVLDNSIITFGKTAITAPAETLANGTEADKMNTSNNGGVNLNPDGTTAINLFGATADTTGAGHGLGTNLFVAGTTPADTTMTKAAKDNVSEAAYQSTVTYTLTATPTSIT